MDPWEMRYLEHVDTSDEPDEFEQAREGCMKLMRNDDSYLSELTFVHFLGKGKIGTVALYLHNTTGDFVVDKFSKEEYWNQTVSEAHCMTRLSGNKYFLSPLAYFISPSQRNRNHLIMEYFPGKNLCNFLKDKILNLSDVQYILRQLGEAFVYMHSKGVIHVDVKPQNILINDRLECKVIDFSHSTFGPEGRDIWGTKEFAAPEVMLHKRLCFSSALTFGYSSDYYSLGLTVLSIAANLCHPDFLTDIMGPTGQRYLATAVALQSALNPDGPDDTFYDLIKGLTEEDRYKRLDDRTFLQHPFFSKEFKKKSEALTKEEVLSAIKKFKPKRYRRNISRSEIATEFQEKIARNNNAKALMAKRFSSVIKIICQNFDIPIPKDSSKNKTSVFSRLKQGLKLKKR